MTTYTIYHNPRCSKSRQTLELLQERGIEPEVIEYLKSPPSLLELKAISEKLGRSPLAMTRTKEGVFSELGLAAADTHDEQLLEAIAANPILLERPIVVCDDQAVVGRPPENVLVLL